MNIQQIESFIFVAETGSFSKAGELLFLTQPSVSSRVQSLENELGCLLFERSGKTISLTEEGRTFLPFAEQIMQNISEGKSAIQQARNSLEGELHISSVTIAANYILPTLLKDFYLTYPNVKLGIHTGHSHQVLEMVLNYEAPIGISRTVDHPQIENIHLMSDEMVLVASANHPFSQLVDVTINQIASEPFIMFNRGSHDWTLINEAFQKVDLRPNAVIEVDSIEVVKQMIKKQVGIAILSKFAVEDDVKANLLKTVTVSDMAKIQRNFDIIYLKNKKLNSITKLFVEFLLREFSKRLLT